MLKLGQIPTRMALAGSPLNIPKSNIKGNGEAYQSWNNDQIIAILPTIFKCSPVKISSRRQIFLDLTFYIFFYISKPINSIKHILV